MVKKEKHIKPGYHLTEVGIIPMDWKIEDIESIFASPGGLVRGPFGGALKKDIFVKRGYKVYEQKNAIYKNSTLGKYYIDSLKFQELKRFRVEAGDFILSCSGTIGKLYQLPPGIEDGIINQALLKLKINPHFSDRYFNHYFEWEKFQDKIIDNTQGGAMKNLVGMPIFKATKMPFPSSKSEQSRIAHALSDTNTLIASLDELIGKKKSIKQGTMQELLTGKKRLPGFNGKWTRKKLGDIGNITGSGVDKTVNPEEFPVTLLNFLDVFHSDFIYKKDLHHVVTATKEKTEKCNIKKGDIFFTPSSEMPYDIGISAVAMEDMDNVVYSYHIDRFRLTEDWDLLFRAYIFQTKDFTQQASTQCEGGGKRYVLSLTAFRERLTVLYPIDKNEQSAIGKILFDMDSEISELEKKRDKYKQIKHGMMSELLTGNIRLLGVK